MDENQAAKKPMTKTEIYTALSEATGLTKEQVGSLSRIANGRGP